MLPNRTLLVSDQRMNSALENYNTELFLPTPLTLLGQPPVLQCPARSLIGFLKRDVSKPLSGGYTKRQANNCQHRKWGLLLLILKPSQGRQQFNEIGVWK
ncbi:hypothetical protein J6590_051109 [Homalodisca vitripennis]|nr:hypothetical protein J6590_051109 [Homalodisca vitripennis]